MKNFHEALSETHDEYHAAVKKFPNWPDDVFKAATIMAEEFGEVMKEINDIYLHKTSTDKEGLKAELAQCAAMCLRLRANLEEYKEGK